MDLRRSSIYNINYLISLKLLSNYELTIYYMINLAGQFSL